MHIAEDPHPSPGKQPGAATIILLSPRKRLMVIQAGQDLDPDLSGEPLAKMVKTDNIK